MRKYSFTQKNKGRADAALSFPKFVLDRKGDQARIALFSLEEAGEGKLRITEPRPEGGYFFDLHNPLSEERTYVGSYECLAPEEVKEDEEFDPATCPHCEFVEKGIGTGGSVPIIGKRRRKFVLPIVIYRTDPRGNVMEPFSVDIKSWKFTDRYFNQIVDEHERWNLLKHDLRLTSNNPKFHGYTISVEPDCAFRSSKERLSHTIRVYRSALELVPGGLLRQQGLSLKPDDLRRRVQGIVDEVHGGFRGKSGYGSVSAAGVEAETLEEVLTTTNAVAEQRNGGNVIQEMAETLELDGDDAGGGAPAASQSDPVDEIDFDEFIDMED